MIKSTPNNLLNSVFLNTDYFAHCFHKALRFTVCMGRHTVYIKNKPVRVCRNKPIGISCSLCVGISWSLCWNKLMPVYWNKPTWRLRLSALGSHRSQCYTHCPREDVNPDFKVDIAGIATWSQCKRELKVFNFESSFICRFLWQRHNNA